MDGNQVATLAILVYNTILLLGCFIYALKCIRPYWKTFDRFTHLIIPMVFIGMTFDLLSTMFSFIK